MAVELHDQAGDGYLTVQLSGKLTKEDYEKFVPKIEQRIRDKGKLRLLVELLDFHGWEMAALWEDIKFDAKHFKDIEQLALVGHSKWEQGMATFCKPFTAAKVRYFDESKLADAQQWLGHA
jgi:hypothetical protein